MSREAEHLRNARAARCVSGPGPRLPLLDGVDDAPGVPRTPRPLLAHCARATCRGDMSCPQRGYWCTPVPSWVVGVLHVRGDIIKRRSLDRRLASYDGETFVRRIEV